jgi:hypothetical protein
MLLGKIIMHINTEKNTHNQDFGDDGVLSDRKARGGVLLMWFRSTGGKARLQHFFEVQGSTHS